jgi:hypothetical protein
VALLPAALLLLAGCVGGSGEPDSKVNLAPFKKMAKGAWCSDTRNRLFLIDGQLVFWDKAGECSDAAYVEALYGRTHDQRLCVLRDSIAGPVKDCPDASYEEIFDTIVANLDEPDLGLGPEHTVEQVNF